MLTFVKVLKYYKLSATTLKAYNVRRIDLTLNIGKMTISQPLRAYLVALKSFNQFEKYETLLLAMLHDNFLNELNKIIDATPKELRFQITITKKYKDIVHEICGSVYFDKNFSQKKILQKSEFLQKAPAEIMLNLYKFDSESGEVMLTSDLPPETSDDPFSGGFVDLPYFPISHQEVDKEDKDGYELYIPKDANLNDVIGYCEEILSLTRRKKKRPQTLLGRDLRIHIIEQEVKEDKEKFIKKYEFDYPYPEQFYAKELKDRYGEEMEMEAIQKALTRIKKKKKLINTQSDN